MKLLIPKVKLKDRILKTRTQVYLQNMRQAIRIRNIWSVLAFQTSKSLWISFNALLWSTVSFAIVRFKFRRRACNWSVVAWFCGLTLLSFVCKIVVGKHSFVTCGTKTSLLVFIALQRKSKGQSLSSSFVVITSKLEYLINIFHVISTCLF